jgi:hypothetical protein
MSVAIISLVIAGITLLATVIGLYWQNLQLNRDLRTETDYKRNAADHGFAVACLLSIGRRWINPGGGRSQGAAFDLVFPDADLRRRIVMYLGTRNSVGDFIPFQLTADQLQNPECCRTIGDVLDAIGRARHADWADTLQLPQKS